MSWISGPVLFLTAVPQGDRCFSKGIQERRIYRISVDDEEIRGNQIIFYFNSRTSHSAAEFFAVKRSCWAELYMRKRVGGK